MTHFTVAAKEVTFIVEADSSAKAIEEVEERLGENAFDWGQIYIRSGSTEEVAR
jgi:hypothetical protein